MKEVVAGVDIGGTNTVAGIVDRSGAILAETSFPTSDYDKAEAYISKLCSVITELVSKVPGSQLKAVGIGAPNANYLKGTIEHPANLKWKGITPLAELTSAQLSVPVAVTNDANAATIGEMIFGKAKGLKDFVMITLGTGLGSGIVSNGHLVYGHDGFAGEIGHTVAQLGGRLCGCGKRGCLETYVSATGLVRTMTELLADSNQPCPLRDVPNSQLTSKQIFEAAQAGDALAKSAFERTGAMLGFKMADTVAHTSPKAIYLFGGLAKAGDLIIAPAQKAMEEHLLPIFRGKVSIEVSGLQDANAAILGSSALAWNELSA